jgi:hypothetical protein
MRFPSFVILARHAREVVVRFPWTMAAGVLTAAAAIVATTQNRDSDEWMRITMVCALALPLTVALTLFAQERGWSAARAAVLNLAGVLGLLGFYLVWPGPERKYESIRYFQLSAGLHLLVAFLPFLGQRETIAFWQYNRRLFLGFLRANIFSIVLFVGLAVALAALDHLFGVDVPSETYGRLWLVIVFVINTGIFLAAVPRGLAELAGDTSYPRVLKVFAQYILTPLVFIYLLLLLAYLVKILAGGEWPSGWIGWLVTSVAVAGLLGFLLVYPLRHEPSEAWIRTYSRWLFVGLIPAAAMLLVAFWKRVLPYGLTELRLLGILLGLWLLAISVSYTVRRESGIRKIPLTLALLLLLTLYGPLSVTSTSVASQARRLARLVAQPTTDQEIGREATSALQFLLEHGARRQVIGAFRRQLPEVNWAAVVEQWGPREKALVQFLEVAGVPHVPESSARRGNYVHLWARQEPVIPIGGYEWMVKLWQENRSRRMVGSDSLIVAFDQPAGMIRVSVGGDTFWFDVRRVAATIPADPSGIEPERLRLKDSGKRYRALLALESVSGRRSGSSIEVDRWNGTLFIGEK